LSLEKRQQGVKPTKSNGDAVPDDDEDDMDQ
jgi:hypothetical protein